MAGSVPWMQQMSPINGVKELKLHVNGDYGNIETATDFPQYWNHL